MLLMYSASKFCPYTLPSFYNSISFFSWLNGLPHTPGQLIAATSGRYLTYFYPQIFHFNPTMSEVFDYIIVGGGGSGCVVAGRLTENPATRVLVLERGKNNKGDAMSEQPAMYLANLANGNTHHHTSEPAESNGNKRVPVPVGNILGGGTSVNFLMYTRPGNVYIMTR